MNHELPFAAPGQSIGLLGGSFDPPHGGHVHVTREALKRFDLDAVWWLVSPGNPLKSRGPAPMTQRMAAAHDIMQHPKVVVSDLEARIGTRYTAETLGWLQGHRPKARFVWLMGADNLAQFHRWDRWRWILDHVPVGVIARPGQRLPARTGRAAGLYERYRLPGRASHLLSRSKAPAWCFVNVPLNDMSSTQIRAEGGWAGAS